MTVATTMYTSRIIKASALLPDTKLLLSNWNINQDVKANLLRVRQANIFGKASRSRIEDILRIFQHRYLSDPPLLRALVILVQQNFRDEGLDRILYFQTLRADRLLLDVVTQVLAPRAQSGQQEITVHDIEEWIGEQIAAGKTIRAWNDETANRVAQGIMATLRDFGLLQGVINKRIVPIYLPTTAFSFIAFQLSVTHRSGDKLLHAPEWNAFLLHRETVERLFLEAHQERLLEYYAAGRVIRIEFPATSIEEYAHALTQRTY